jgi:uncharacterized protein (DUF362 family)
MCNRAKSRRAFIRDLAVVTAGTVLGTALPGRRGASSDDLSDSNAPSRVILARDTALRDTRGGLNPETTSHLVDKVVKKITGLGSARDAWSSLFTPKDVVGLKVNCLAGRRLSTSPEVVQAVIHGLMLAGVPEDQVVIWDRTNKDLKKGGYRIRTQKGGVMCFGTDALYRGYEQEPRIFGSVGSCFSRILTEHCTAIVNLPVLKDHDLAGVTLGMKNFYGVIHNPNKYHDNNCNPYVADLFSSPLIQSKLRLTLLDAATGLYEGGPSFKPQWVWNYNGILGALDTVALDRVGAGIIEKKRAEKGLPSLEEAKRVPAYIRTASGLGLGQEDLEKIELVRI